MEILHFEIGLQKQTPEGSGWSQLLHCTEDPTGLCAQPSPVHGENSIVKFEGDTAIISWITDHFQRSYCVAINNLAEFCRENNLLLKLKELIVDLRGEKEAKTQAPVYIRGAEVKQEVQGSGNQHYRDALLTWQ